MFEDFLEAIDMHIIGPTYRHTEAGMVVFFCVFIIALGMAVHQAKSEANPKQQSQVQCQCVHSKQILPEMP